MKGMGEIRRRRTPKGQEQARNSQAKRPYPDRYLKPIMLMATDAEKSRRG